MTNKIEQIMVMPVAEILANAIHPNLVNEVATEVAKRQSAALDAAGLKVLPKEITDEMLSARPDEPCDFDAEYRRVVAAFDPTTYDPEPTE